MQDGSGRELGIDLTKVRLFALIIYVSLLPLYVAWLRLKFLVSGAPRYNETPKLGRCSEASLFIENISTLSVRENIPERALRYKVR